jgi:hypothetical protein
MGCGKQIGVFQQPDQRPALPLLFRAKRYNETGRKNMKFYVVLEPAEERGFNVAL